MRKLIVFLFATILATPSFAADNAVILDPGTTITMRTKDVGSGVQSPFNILGDTSGSAIYGTAGSANANVLSIQGIASMTPLLANPGTAANWGVGATAAAVPANTNYIGVNVGGNLVGLAPGTAGTASTQVFTVQGVTSMTPVQVSQATAATLNATVVGTGTFATQSAVTAASGSYSSGAFASGSFASGSHASGSFASGAFASGSVASGAMVDLGAIADAAATVGSTGTLSAKLRLMTSQLDAINTSIQGSIPAGTNVIGYVGGDGTAGTASSHVLSVQGVASMTPILATATLSAETTKVIGTVRVSAMAAAARNAPGCTVGTSSAQCLAAAQAVNFLQIQNTNATSTNNIACNIVGGTAVLNSATSIQLAPGQSASWGPSTGGVPSGAINCIATSASSPLYVEWN